jgi:hypothetical protein
MDRRGVEDSRMALLVVHLVAVAYLTGLSWVVQLVIYPGFRAVGPTAAWSTFHDAHSRGMTLAVVVPWLVQGVTVVALLVVQPAGVPLWLLLLTGLLAAVTVAVTALWSVPLHSRLHDYDRALIDRLISTHRLRTAAWTAGTACAAAMVLLAA